MTYLPLWTGILKRSPKRYSNSHIENYWKILKERCNESKAVGKTPAKALRVIKEIESRTLSVYNRYVSAIPKTSQKNKFFKNISNGSLAELHKKSESWNKKK